MLCLHLLYSYNGSYSALQSDYCWIQHFMFHKFPQRNVLFNMWSRIISFWAPCLLQPVSWGCSESNDGHTIWTSQQDVSWGRFRGPVFSRKLKGLMLWQLSVSKVLGFSTTLTLWSGKAAAAPWQSQHRIGSVYHRYWFILIHPTPVFV